MFRIKICGITRPEDAEVAFDAGADAIGLNFYSQSSRYIDAELARVIAQSVSNSVGVFVNSSADEILRLSQTVGLDAIQLHGDEPPQILQRLSSINEIVRARSLGSQGIESVTDHLRECKQAGRLPDVVLIDAAVQGQYGGTGECADWDQVKDYQSALLGVPLILAGGLGPENVAEAIEQVEPYGVDVASGVEASPGVKDHSKMRDFIQAAKEALSKFSSSS